LPNDICTQNIITSTRSSCLAILVISVTNSGGERNCRVACATATGMEYVRTPGGWSIHKYCVHHVSNGHRIDMDKIRDCPFRARAPEAQVYAIDTYYQAPANGLVTQMNTSWTTPALPVNLSTQTVYFWPGFKSEQPVMGYPVLQPVLQYGQEGRYWMLQSWFVWGAKGIAYTAPAIAISPGNEIDSYMLYNNSTSEWTCWGINKATNQTSDLILTSAKIQDTVFQYAMLVLETIMPTTNECKLYPGGDDQVVFKNIKVNNAVPKWTVEVTQKDCNQAATVNNDNTVTFSWTN